VTTIAGFLPPARGTRKMAKTRINPSCQLFREVCLDKLKAVYRGAHEMLARND